MAHCVFCLKIIEKTLPQGKAEGIARSPATGAKQITWFTSTIVSCKAIQENHNHDHFGRYFVQSSMIMINAFWGFEPQVELFESTCIVRNDNLAEERKHSLMFTKIAWFVKKNRKKVRFFFPNPFFQIQFPFLIVQSKNSIIVLKRRLLIRYHLVFVIIFWSHQIFLLVKRAHLTKDNNVCDGDCKLLSFDDTEVNAAECLSLADRNLTFIQRKTMKMLVTIKKHVKIMLGRLRL